VKGVPRRILESAAHDLNPVPMAKSVWDAAKSSRFGSPELLLRLLAPLVQAQGAQFGKAKTAFQEGRMSEAVGYTGAGLMPVIGPAAARAGETMGSGQVPEGIGQLLALLAGLGLPKAAQAVKSNVAIPPMVTPRPEVAYGLKAGIPVDLATATGNRFVKGLQAATEHTPIGGLVEKSAAADTSAALTAEAQRLANQSLPRAISPDIAGTMLQKSLEAKAKTHMGEANTAYGKLRELEGSPEASALVNARTGAIDLPGVSAAEVAEVRRMLAELEEIQYTRRGMAETAGQGSTKEWTAGHRNANVYADVMREANSPIPAVELRGRLEAVLNGEPPNVWFKRAVEVARKRLAGDRSVHQPLLPPDAGTAGLETHAPMQAPVDLRPVKAKLAPIAQELEGQLSPLKGLPTGMRLSGADQATSTTLLNVRRLMELPDLAPASAVDPLLSSLKRYVGGADSALARTRGQGIVAGAIRELEGQLAESLAKIGPEATEALAAGRTATKAKYATLEARKGLGKEPVRAFRKLVQPGDANLAQLQTIAQMKPQVLPVMGRAVLDSWFDLATKDRGFQHAARLRANWQKLGPKTKELLFRDPAYIKDLDAFFTLAAELTTEFNPSRTALVGTAAGSVGGLLVNPVPTIAAILGAGGLAKAMHSPAFVKALVTGMRLPARAGAQKAAALEQAVVLGREAAAGAGAVPSLAAERPDEPGTPTRSPSGSRQP
jgi:hypothetical protein